MTHVHEYYVYTRQYVRVCIHTVYVRIQLRVRTRLRITHVLICTPYVVGVHVLYVRSICMRMFVPGLEVGHVHVLGVGHASVTHGPVGHIHAVGHINPVAAIVMSVFIHR